jgi:hypothetical protein
MDKAAKVGSWRSCAFSRGLGMGRGRDERKFQWAGQGPLLPTAPRLWNMGKMRKLTRSNTRQKVEMKGIVMAESMWRKEMTVDGSKLTQQGGGPGG